jgi:hypothetical protein
LRALKKYYSELTGLFVLILYLFTIAPSVVQIDSGELSAVIDTLGIAHPTGYPLFTIIGYLFLLIPLPFSQIFQTNLLAALWCSGGIVFFVKSVKYIFDNLPGKTAAKLKAKKSKREKTETEKLDKLPELVKIYVSVLSGMLLAFSFTFWFQSTSIEVYSLHILLINIVIYILLKAYFSPDSNSRNKYWYLLAAALALSFSNHMTTLLMLPGIAYLFINREKITGKSFMLLGKMLSIFFPLLILIYSYLPIRASFNPLLNWSNPGNFENFMRHFSGKQYQVWLFSSTDAAKKQLAYFFSNYTSEFTIIGLLLILAGIILSFIKFRTISYLIIILFSATVLYSINYDIVDIDSYFLLAYIVSVIVASFAFLELIGFLLKKNLNAVSAGSIILIPVVLIAVLNFGRVNQSGNYIFEDYTKSLMNSVEENAIILSYQWDYFLSASYYYQFVENHRRDIAVIDKELLRRSWYYPQLEICYPGILKGIEKDISIFLREIQPFERSEKFNPQLLETTYRKIMSGLITENINDREIYIAPEIVDNEMRAGQFQLPAGYYLVPELFLYRITRSVDYMPCPPPEFSFRGKHIKNKYTDFIKNITASMLSNRAVYEMNYDRHDKAKIYVKKISDEFPDYKLPENLKALF